MNSTFRANLFMLLFFLIYLMGGSLITLLAIFLFPGASAFISTVFIYLLLFGGAVLLYGLRCHLSWKETLGLKSIPLYTGLLSFVIGLLLQPVLLLISYLSQFAFRNFVDSSLSDMLSMPLPALLLITALLPAVFEELICRGLVLRAYKDHSPWLGILISSLFFALLHGNLQQSLYALGAGLALGFMASATGSLWPSVIAHFTINASQILMASLFPAETEIEVSAFSWIDLGIYAGLTFITLPLLFLCLRQLWRIHKKDRPLSPKPFSVPSLPIMWPFYLYLLLSLGICVSAEFLSL